MHEPPVGRRGPRPRVLHVITDLRVGGAEVQLARLLERDDPGDADAEVVGVACLRAGGEIALRLEAMGVRVWRLGASGPLGFLRATVTLARILRRERVDVVMGWLYHAMIATALPGVTPRRCRVLWNVRGTVPTASDKRGTRAALRVSILLAGRPARIVYNSAKAQREHEQAGYPGAVGTVIANGFDVPVETPAPPSTDTPVILLAARYHPMKDFEGFLRALALVRASGTPARGRLVGEGCEWSNASLVALLDETGTRPHVELGGMVRPMAPEYQAATVVCSSSAWGEGFHNVLAEALLAGRVAVSTDVGDARMIAGDDRFVVPPSRPDLLASALGTALGLAPAERARVIAEARERIGARFGAPAMRTRYARLYREAVDASH